MLKPGKDKKARFQKRWFKSESGASDSARIK